MTRFYVPLDVNYQTDDKITAAGPMSECLYIRSLAYAKRIGSEGRIHRTQLRALALGIPGRPDKYAHTLVNVGLWEETPDGWRITGWLKHNLTNGALAEQKAKIRARSIMGNHKRHHIDKGIVDDECELCTPPPAPPPIKDAKPSRKGRKKLPTEEEEEQKQKTKTTEETSHRDTTARPTNDHPSSSSNLNRNKERKQLATAVAKILASKRTDVTSYGWIVNTAAGLLDERSDDIDECIVHGYSIETAVALLTSLPVKHDEPIIEAWYANPNCEFCGGEGWVKDDNGYLIECSCRQHEPYPKKSKLGIVK